MRSRWVPALVALVTVVSCGDGGPGTVSSDPPAAGWTRLPDPPLSARNGAVAAWTGDEVVVVGGWEFLCPPGADCSAPEELPFADGAAFGPDTRTWRPIAPAPQGMANAEAAVVDGDVYLLAPGEDEALLRYRPAADRWDTLPAPPSGTRGYLLTAAGADLIAYRESDEQAELPDWRLDPSTATWERLPDDPLVPSYDRQVIWAGDHLLVFAKAVDEGSSSLPSIEGARLDADGTWAALPEAPGSGFQAWAIDDVVVVNPHFGVAAGGGIFDPSTDTWSPLPRPPTAATWQGDMAGALAAETAVYEYGAGWVLDVPADRWVEIPPLDDRSNAATTPVGRDLFLFGGDRWNEGGTRGDLADDAWLWTAPSP